MSVAIIVGTGLGELLEGDNLESVATAYGETLLWRHQDAGRTVFVLPRHGPGHRVPPHRINYRANVSALKQLGCRAAVATNAVGSLRTDLGVGSFALPDQFIDMTRQRAVTFYDGTDGQVVHTDVTDPYCPSLRQALRHGLETHGVSVAEGVTYLCTEGPRFETPAEIRMFAQWGADLVGMTGVPEVVLAREAGICYASVCVVTNLAAGLATGPLNEQQISATASACFATLAGVLMEVVASLPDPWPCRCAFSRG
ncbi:MAG: S-methyl-5'-thioinosine phosphorylase [Armatimonadetes bacterium]|nr:S-methyl-5'-thioinosine phosphorylase [Armatimonadota bacterium]